MTGNTKFDGDGHAALGEALERYGSDRTRWPAPVRRDLAGLLAGNAEAQRRLAEAEALDRLLDLMPDEPEIDTRALASRIMAAAEAEAPIRTRAPVPARRVAPSAESPWAAAALLAASLVLGTVFGVSGTFNSALETVASSAETSDEASTDPGQIAFDSGSLDLFEEDLL